MVARRADALHLERQPAARARHVVDELHVVARAAVAGDMFAALAGMGVWLALVGHPRGDGPLQAVHLRRLHRIQLLTADQAVVRQLQHLVLRHLPEAGV